MVNINDILSKPYSDTGAYKVPEGYFDTLNERILKNVETNRQKKKRLGIAFIKRFAVAACLTALIASIGVTLWKSSNADSNNNVATLANTTDKKDDNMDEQYYNDCIEYAMIDNDDIYKYIAEQ